MMWNFLICGILLLVYTCIRFKKKVFYPSVIFCFMWGMNCISHFLIYAGYVTPLTPLYCFEYEYMGTYIIFYTIATLVGFSMAHLVYRDNINTYISIDFIDRILYRYRWIMKFNFWGGILRFIVMVKLVGFSFSNVIAYRVAANAMMMSVQYSFEGWVFRITAYINMLAIIYIALAGLRSGISELNLKKTLKLFILFAPVQMATGGRLFILYFLIFYFGCFVMGRGISMQIENRKWITKKERMAIFSMMIIMMPLVAAISLARGEGGVANITNSKVSFFDSFTYISEGIMVSDQCMKFFSGGDNLKPTGGSATFMGKSEAMLMFASFKHTTVYASSVSCIIYPLFLDFGYWGSIIVWAILAFFIECLALKNLSKLTLLRFIIYAMLLKICYESVITNPIAANKPFFELLILFALLYKRLFGKYEFYNEK